MSAQFNQIFSLIEKFLTDKYQESVVSFKSKGILIDIEQAEEFINNRIDKVNTKIEKDGDDVWSGDYLELGILYFAYSFILRHEEDSDLEESAEEK